VRPGVPGRVTRAAGWSTKNTAVLHPRSWHFAQARGPLSALRTLGAMLAPRARGTFESDMAEGIVVQVSPGHPRNTLLAYTVHPGLCHRVEAR